MIVHFDYIFWHTVMRFSSKCFYYNCYYEYNCFINF